MNRTWMNLLFGTALLAAACGSGDGGAVADASSGTPDAGGSNDAGASDPDADLNGFVVRLVALVPATAETPDPVPAHTAVGGKVYDGPTPQTVIWTVEEEGGGCKLSTPKAPYCMPGSCGASEACVADGVCHKYATAVDVGLVHVKGLGPGAFDMEAIAGNYTFVGALPYPPAAEGTAIEVTAPGGMLGPIAISAKAIAPLQVIGAGVHPVLGQPLPLAWNPPGMAGVSRMVIKLDLSHHGGIKGKIDCDVPDNGSLQIPAAQITKLLGLGVSGFPTVVFTRTASGVAATARGRVHLDVVSDVELPVEIEGLVSCTKDEECPAGKKCQVDNQCK
jgi:hypothetical protein